MQLALKWSFAASSVLIYLAVSVYNVRVLVRRVQIQSEAHCVIQMEHLECLTRRQDRPVAARSGDESARIPTIVTTLHLSTQLPNTLSTKAAQPLACHLVSILRNNISVSFATQNT